MSARRLLVCMVIGMMVLGALPLSIGTAGADGASSRDADNNGDFASATPIIGDDIWAYGELTGNGDPFDFFKIELNNTGAGAQKLIVNATSDGAGPVRLSVFDPDTYWIAADTTLGQTSYLEVIVEWSGWYYVSLEGQGTTFPYTIRFQKNSVPWSGDSNTDAANATVVATFPFEATDVPYENKTDPQDFYKVHLERVVGDHVDILMAKVVPPEGAGKVLFPEIYWASNNTGVPGKFLTKGSSFINPPIGQIFSFFPPITADYLVRIWGPEGADNYDILMKKVTANIDSNTDAASAEELLSSGHTASTSSTSAEVIDEKDFYRFIGKMKMHFNATLESLDYDAEMNMPTIFLSVQNSTGYEFIEADLEVFQYSATPFAYLEGDLPENDTYYVVVDGIKAAGNYDLDLTVNTPPQVIVPWLDDDFEMFIWENGENASLVLNDVFEDFDGDPVTYSHDAASNANLDVTIYPNSTVLFKPAPSFKGITCANISAQDDQGGVGTQMVCAHVYGVNHEPYIVKSFNETFTNNILGLKFKEVKSDINLTAYFDDMDESDKHWFQVTGNDKVYISFQLEMPQTPDKYHTGLVTIVAPESDEVTESVQFFCKDNGWPNKVSEPLNLTIQVSSGEIKVVSKNAAQLRIDEDSYGEFSVKDYLFFKPPPPPDDTLAFSETSSANLGITITDGVANITPVANWCGSEDVVFTATGVKNTKATNSTTLRVAVTCINDPPVMSAHSPDGAQTVPEGGYRLFSVNITDVDTETGLIKYKWMVDGVVQPSLTSEFNYTPDYTDSGMHNVSVEVNDSLVAITYLWDVVEVTEVNRDPVSARIIEPQMNTSYKKGKKVVLKAGMATDPDGDPLNYTWYDGTVEISKNQTTEYKFKKKGQHEVRLVVDDGRGGEMSAVVTIKIKEDKEDGPGFEGLVLVVAVVVAVALMSWRRKR